MEWWILILLDVTCMMCEKEYEKMDNKTPILIVVVVVVVVLIDMPFKKSC
jgi:uncharacterized protein (DUF983 family)